MNTFFKALIKSIFGDAANTLAVLVAAGVAFVLAGAGQNALAGWGLVAVLLPAMVWLAGSYGRPKD
ncbi:hypothetical protein [Acidihalobacter ferrooxydans]|uniref:Uncharacterized protein n=1 Tax=Acidihalobacter ferrooxydans TaxID=1765967 RepID=A0A1P8UHT6_9GAMM|nr:hypothetical protein [Acidihalobacter ferrooxydans]APZ43408.1 hypothetical protein BW247_10145 [Acidihalobacter ferrooxydans]